MEKIVYLALGFIFLYIGIESLQNGLLFLGIFLIFLPNITIYRQVFYKKNTKKIPIVLLLYIVIAIFMFVFNIFYNATNEITATWRYKGILEDFGDSPLISHFPKKIPENAKNIKFSFLPMFLQGGGHIYLKYNTNNAEIKKIYDEFTPKALKENDVMQPELQIIGENNNDYRILYNFVHPYKNKTEEYYWNHGEESGIAFDMEHNNIIYWSEFW